jgi:hypothetical protein
MVAMQDDYDPVQVLLHVRRGYIFELEIYRANLLKLDLYEVSLDRVKYTLNIDSRSTTIDGNDTFPN